MFGSRQMLAKCSTDVINIAGDDIKRERVIRYLGAFLDEYLTFKDHIKRKCRVAMMNFFGVSCLSGILTYISV